MKTTQTFSSVIGSRFDPCTFRITETALLLGHIPRSDVVHHTNEVRRKQECALQKQTHVAMTAPVCNQFKKRRKFNVSQFQMMNQSFRIPDDLGLQQPPPTPPQMQTTNSNILHQLWQEVRDLHIALRQRSLALAPATRLQHRLGKKNRPNERRKTLLSSLALSFSPPPPSSARQISVHNYLLQSHGVRKSTSR
jgi:hypothetical protein